MTIMVNSNTVTGLLSSFKNEMDKMEVLNEKIQASNSNIRNTWTGVGSDDVTSEIDSYKKVFEETRQQNEKYKEFINEVIDKYIEFDDSEKQTINEHQRAFDTSLYGRIDSTIPQMIK